MFLIRAAYSFQFAFQPAIYLLGINLKGTARKRATSMNYVKRARCENLASLQSVVLIYFYLLYDYQKKFEKFFNQQIFFPLNYYDQE